MVTKSTGEKFVFGDKFIFGLGPKRAVYDLVQDIEKDSPGAELSLPRMTRDGQNFRYADSPQEMKGVLFGVLDHGYVGLIDFMGDDSRIVQAARVSYGAGTKKLREDRGLIRYLMRHSHTTPFEMVELAYIAKLPIFTARQWIRHRTANVNEHSMRYSEATDEFYIPDPARVLAQSKRNKQASEGELPVEVREEFVENVRKTAAEAFERYQKAIESGVSREMARILLPVNAYTKWHWKIDLHNLFHFLELRLDEHAQWEIRQYATPMYEMARVVAPAATEAFEDFVLRGTKLSRKEQDALSLIMAGRAFDQACEAAGIELRRPDGRPMTTGEGVEFRERYDSIKSRAENLLRVQ